VVMLTGDHHQSAQKVAKEVGITQIYAKLLPQEKAAMIDTFHEEGHVVVMAGDGINDTIALARSNIAIAMGNGADVAISVSDVVLMVGARLNWLLSHGKGKQWGEPGSTKFIQIDIEPREMDSNVEIAAPLVGDIGSCASALLEAMEERQVTVDGTTYPLAVPFLVLATQNPIEYEGTFPLPEAQLDRFMVRATLGYPSKSSEMAILKAQQLAHPIDKIGQIVDLPELLAAQQAVKTVRVDELVQEYIVLLVEASRKHPDVYLGASPRGSLALFKGAQAWAAVQLRDYVTPDDVKALAVPTLSHRLILNPAARIKNVDPRGIIQELLSSIPVPGSRVPASRS